MLNGNKISTWLGAPPNHWKKNEVNQIKQIHRCYRTAYAGVDEDGDVNITSPDEEDFTLKVGNNVAKVRRSKKKKKQEDDDVEDASDSEAGGKDEEDYLSASSPLRSKNGDKKAPANPTFRDYDAFLNSCRFDHWGDEFNRQSEDKLLAETAQTVVANICSTQSRSELRVNHGKIPMRKIREHITPLSLTLHELKLWATNQLRTASVFDEATYKEIHSRRSFLSALAHKEVWGEASKISALQAGMSDNAQNVLFRLFLTISENLERAEEYAYRGYCRRSSREKLQRAGDSLKDVLIREMKFISASMELDQKLSDPKTPKLQPLMLLNTSQAQTFIDFTNLANVLMYRLTRNPLVRGVLTSEFEKKDVKEEIEDIAHWSANNLFVRPALNSSTDPEFLLDKHSSTRILPEVYASTAKDLTDAIKAINPKAPTPPGGSKHVARLKKAFDSEAAAGNVVRLVMQSCAAVQEIVPSIYALHQLWILAGDGGDFTIYDTLRDQVISVMSDAVDRVNRLQNAQTSLLKEIGKLCKVKEDTIKALMLKKKKMLPKPAWVMNLKTIKTSMIPQSKKGVKTTHKQLMELAKDAFDYNLTTDELDDKVENAKRMIANLTGKSPETEKAEVKKMSTTGKFQLEKKPDWMQVDKSSGAEFGANNAFSDSMSAGGKSEAYNPFEDADSDEDDDV